MSYSLSSLEATLSFATALFSFLLACIVAVKDHRSFAGRSFVACLGSLALVQFFLGLSIKADTPDGALTWEQLRTVFGAIQPGTFLLFSLAFARLEHQQYLARWKYVIAAAFALPILTLAVLWQAFFEYPPILGPWGQSILPLGYAGKIFYSVLLISAVLILANMERTFRASTGRIRWQIKFVVLGMGMICAVWIYTSSQALIYSALDTSISIVYIPALFLANLVFLWGLVRSRFLNVDVYLSRVTIQYSLTAILASIYLISIGILSYIVRSFDVQWTMSLAALAVLFALAGLAMLLMSDRLNERIKRFVTRHFERPVYDYRKVWMDLTEQTNGLVDVCDLCTAVGRIISKTFNILSVNIWLYDEARESLALAGSTVFTPAQAQELERRGRIVSDLMRTMDGRSTPLDLKKTMVDWPGEIMQAKPEYFAEFKMRYILPIQTGGQLVGIVTLNDDRVGKTPLSLEDFDLLNAYASQLAARALQLRLSENVRKAQEIESFQNVSAFFVHDLKNLASRLSLTMQNLPEYFDNPEFKADALKLIRKSAAKINATITRLSSLRQIEIKPVQTDLNTLLEATLGDFECSTRFELERDFRDLPAISVDPEQVQKVVTNLVMNAYEATGDKGSIHVATSTSDHKVIFSITDNGCGMSRQFIDKMLFRPFSTTKKRGLGIGLFHCRMIVEAHHGRIEVESEEGKGSTFRVILPVQN